MQRLSYGCAGVADVHVHQSAHCRGEIPAGIDPGFTHNPGIAGIQFAADKNLDEKLATTSADIAKAVAAIEPPDDDQ